MNEQLYLIAIGLSYAEKLEKSLLTIREYEKAALAADPDGFNGCDGYGKDSTVLCHLFKLAGVKHKCHHSLTTIDPPELIHFGRKFHPDTIVHRPEVPLLKYMAEHVDGPPTRINRWCCLRYKEQPLGSGLKVIGVRAQESPRRAKMWRTMTPNRTTRQPILAPILYWTTEDVWRHIHENGLPYCELYDQGFKRLGCIGCPMAGKARAEQFKRWPGYEKAWKRAMRLWWEKWHGVPRQDGGERGFDKKGFTKWEDLWTWWMEEEPEGEDSCQGVLF